ncbi:MAG: NAD-dependent epimerase/dehydratase family protein [Candidatus Bathyarchaeia archaeon]
MNLKEFKKVFVTGAAGFMGSHLCDRLIEVGFEVYGLDNLSTGRIENINHLMVNEGFHFIKEDLLNIDKIESFINECDLIFHFAANPDVKAALANSKIDFEQNLVATYKLLEAMRKAEKPKTIIFASTSTVYGEAKVLPTPEDYAPLKPISLYGATKLGCEALIASYTHTFRLKGLVFRFANIIGSRLKHGVIYDFILKLKANPRRLEVLGDGTQTKSYLHIEDCLNGMFKALENFNEDFEVYNIGGEDQVNVKTIAEIVIKEMGLKNVEVKFLGGPEGRGWIGDVKNMLLDCRKLKALGWKPKHSGFEAIQLTARELIKELMKY